MQCPECGELTNNRRALVAHLGYTHGLSPFDAYARTAPTASATAADLAALRDEVRRLREAQANALAIIDEQAPALTGWRARDVMAALRAALEVTK